MSPRRSPRPRVSGRVLITGNAADIVDQLTEGARREGIELIDVDSTEKADVAIAAVRTSSRSTLALGIHTLDAVSDYIAPEAPRLVIAVRAKLSVAPERLLGPLVREILFQVAVATGGLDGAKKLRTARARFGSALLDAAGLHVFRIGRMRVRPPRD